MLKKLVVAFAIMAIAAPAFAFVASKDGLTIHTPNNNPVDQPLGDRADVEYNTGGAMFFAPTTAGTATGWSFYIAHIYTNTAAQDLGLLELGFPTNEDSTDPIAVPVDWTVALNNCDIYSIADPYTYAWDGLGTFTPAGDRLFGVSLWADPTVRAWSWPEGEELARRVIGPFNWTVTWVPEPPSLWVSRFVEGQVLVLDPENLLVQDRLSLSFGIRAMLHEPVHDLVWAAAAYSGRLWVVEPRAPYRRRAVPVCGQTRDLVSDGQGRVVVSTDCGIFRVDPTAW